jgi:hypothetical protein
LSCDPDTSKDLDDPQAYETGVDTIPIEFTTFDLGNDSFGFSHQRLIKSSINDTIKFEYLTEINNNGRDTTISNDFQFYHHLEEFHEINVAGLECVDTFSLPVLDSIIRIFKFEFIDPPIDGEGALLFNPRFGLIANVSYAWGNKHILSDWEGLHKSLFDSLAIRLLTTDSIILRPSDPYSLQDYLLDIEVEE